MNRLGILLPSAVLLGVALGQAADARRIVIDQGEFLDTGFFGTACTIGGDPCTATTLPFVFDFGSGATDQAFIYDRGVVSFGAPIPDSADPSGSFANFGVPVIAPLYVPGPSGVAGPYEAATNILSPSDFTETLANFGTDLFLITFVDPFLEDGGVDPYVYLILDASPSTGELRFEFIHGQSNTQEGVTDLALPNVSGTLLGYSVLGQQLVDTTPDINAVNAFTVRADAAIPEPGTWAMMLLGFGAVGLSMRRRQRRTAVAQPA